MRKLIFCWFLCKVFLDIVTCLPPTLFGRIPFSVVWNGDSEKCRQKFGIELNFNAYNIVHNVDDSFYGDKMVIFYSKDLGLYPRVLSDGTKLYGGIPQLAPLKDHLNKSLHDINDVICNNTFDGLAVIDWENWRPRYRHNFDSKKIYQTLSKELVRQKYPHWSDHQITRKAKVDFNVAARRFMLSTLRKAATLRPEGRWGFYGFPRCYKHHCIKVRPENNRLGWMFSSSTALYPSLYLKKRDDSWRMKALFVHETLQETFRVFRRFSSVNKTVIVPYTRFRYDNPQQFYNEFELLATIAMSAMKGSAGVILWDKSMNFEQEDLCRNMDQYLNRTLGPFVSLLTNFLQNCSLQRCSGHGRCMEKSDVFWYMRVLTQWQNSSLNQSHNVSYPDINVSDILKNYPYRCQCYPGWSGKACNVGSEI